jgi:hypothetical protein
MSRKRWTMLAVIVAAVSIATVLVVVIGVALLSKGDPVTGPSSPPSAPPSAPGAREAFGFDAAYADPDPMVLVVRYGDSGSCPSEAVSHAAVQESVRVVVTLTRTTMPTGRACTADYKARLVRIPLTAPLGSRAVVDGSRHTPVPISTGSPPLG